MLSGYAESTTAKIHMPTFELNVPPKLTIQHVGNEKTPVIVIDNLACDVEQIRQVGCASGDFEHDQEAGYPGVRTTLPVDYSTVVLEQLIHTLREAYRIPDRFKPKVVFELYSLLTQAPQALSLLQRLPHYDSNRPFYFASVHYLSPGEFAGTGIFRHRPTGFERITEHRTSAYIGAAKAHVAEYGVPPAEYINGSTDHFELIFEIPYQQNRLVLYPGCLLHSGLVDPARDINNDPTVGRLTANLFIDFDTGY